MYSNRLFQKFCSDRNIKPSTCSGYISALSLYENFHGVSIEKLIHEAKVDENKLIPLNNRKIKDRLLDFRAYLLNGDLSPDTSRTYLSKVRTFYLHFDVELPVLPQAKFNKTY